MDIDVFLIAGQSNAAGEGDKSLSPNVTPGKILQIYNGIIGDANDPVGNACDGSAWPAFGNEYYALSGRLIAFIPAAVGGTGLSPFADIGTGHWSGHRFKGQIDLLGMSIEKTDEAFALLSRSGYAPQFKGILWCQGENEAMAINNGAALLQEAYEQMLSNVITRYRNHFGNDIAFYIFKTGTEVGASDKGYTTIRAAQENVAVKMDGVKIVFADAASFAHRNLMRDHVHYAQEGYNEMGMMGARVVWGL